MAPSGKWIEGLSPETSVDEAARRSLEARLSTLAHCLPQAAHLARHDVEHVHRLRVATRRAAAALKLYRDWLPCKPARWMKKRLRKIRRAASDARDLDVFISRIEKVPGPLHESVAPFLAQQRKDVQPEIEKLAAKLRRDDRLVRKTARLIGGIAPPEAANGCEPQHRFGDWARTKLAAITRGFIDAMPDDMSNVEVLHQFRIRAKALRYAIELLSPAFGSTLREEIYSAIEELQERLGCVTDHIAAMRLLTQWCSDEPSAAPIDELKELLETEGRHQDEDLESFRKWWESEHAEALKRFLEEYASFQDEMITQSADQPPVSVGT
jgi:CHAD domain-containing protein